MSGLIATVEPRRIKASHRRRRKVASGQSVQRYYDPMIGRFLSVDPVTADANTGANFNRYKYANNNPYRFTDPDGRQEMSAERFNDSIGSWTPQERAPFEAVAVPATIAIVAATPVIGPELALGARTVLRNSAEQSKVSKADGPYSRPANATTKAQRESVQGKPCVKCGAETTRQVAGHKEALVKEYHQTGRIDKAKMQDVRSVQAECPTCSAKEGAQMSRYSREMNEQFKKPN